mmetsp:Transcript_19002/g.24553  ORF Transcript_19002/g.24553 Transcript_19002/m.24553 type:complete len:117 (-) Transcript_19002:99-449(-)
MWDPICCLSSQWCTQRLLHFSVKVWRRTKRLNRARNSIDDMKIQFKWRQDSSGRFPPIQNFQREKRHVCTTEFTAISRSFHLDPSFLLVFLRKWKRDTIILLLVLSGLMMSADFLH